MQRQSLRAAGPTPCTALPVIPGELTMLTPPELSGRHIPSMGARPTVLPRKARPLRVERGMTGWGQEWPPPSRDPCGDWGHPREQLHGVMWQLCPQPSVPLQEGPECGIRIRCDRALVLLGPHFQASQCHLNVQSPEDLREGWDRPKEGNQAHHYGGTPLFCPLPLSSSPSLPYPVRTCQPLVGVTPIRAISPPSPTWST